MATKPAYLSRLREIDWDFAGSYSESPFSAAHWHPGRFASQLPAALIGTLSGRDDVILDPFAGSGTALVEAQRLGRKSIGIDINPVSCLVCSAKTLDLSASKIAGLLDRLALDATNILGRQINFEGRAFSTVLPPPTVQVRKWYNRRVAQDLAALWELLDSYDSASTTLLGRFAFSAILLAVCRETRHWGYVCDNTTPTGHHEENVLDSFISALAKLKRAYYLRDAELTAILSSDLVSATTLCGDVRRCLAEIDLGSIDLVITSPPYFGVCDYVKAQRLTLEWLGVDIEALRLQEIGARSKRHRAKARDEYLLELCAILSLLHGRVKAGGILAFIIGQSSARGGILEEFTNSLTSNGMKVLLDINRTVSSQRRLTPSIRGEHLIIAENMND